RLPPGDPAGHSLSIALGGRPSHRNATGARVTVVAGGRQFVDEVRGGGSYYAQNDFRLHFGIGSASRVERVVVRWPAGAEEVFSVDGVDRLVTLTEGRGTLRPQPPG